MITDDKYSTSGSGWKEELWYLVEEWRTAPTAEAYASTTRNLESFIAKVKHAAYERGQDDKISADDFALRNEMYFRGAQAFKERVMGVIPPSQTKFMAGMDMTNSKIDGMNEMRAILLKAIDSLSISEE